MVRRRLILLALVGTVMATLALAPAALAKHKDNDAPKIKGKLVEVSLVEWEIQMPPVIKHGWTTFRITNNGTLPHSLSARGTKKTFVLATSVPPGAAVLVPIKLQKGTYTVWDPIEDSAARGMQVTVVVD